MIIKIKFYIDIKDVIGITGISTLFRVKPFTENQYALLFHKDRGMF